ncbi:putative cystathionine gamma-lyase 2 [Varroa destructor]|uniref:cystathionine gamma-lyase n=1 Tax=Varroa destructor TaxID=109461 RepID=A0A7M7K1K0_VARDE|nr:putative cystathionine gamma-lyase 2 [Varroa destructor]XP_022660325.1 putative cystathionine gamma-lyase 2 [Varroa destructor]XP_022660326.1 putative cystathionine gamma-lyase 2 [Varroa destructor]XP_022660327.1 putative cystathionine gamma-lyase 2 [Varroa destructor]
MSENNLFRIETNAIHAGQNPKNWNSNPVIPPISLATTFQQFAPGEHAGYKYARSGNPSRTCLETCIASLEKAKFALCYSSGMAAVDNVLHLVNAGDHIVAFDDLYGGVTRILRHCAVPHGLEVDFVDATDADNVSKALKSNTKLIWVESPSNPMMKIVDIAAVSVVVKKGAPEAILVMDNSFMSPYFQNPLALGADVVMHSVTKYINGHSDALMGCIITNREDIHERLRFLQNAIGAVPSPFDCFLVNRGIKTLAVRMERHQENGLKIARFLESNPQVQKVLHPGLPSHPQHETAKKQCSGFSGMLSFYIKGGEKESRAFLTSLKIFSIAESLGAVESLASLPSKMTHALLPEEQRARLGITNNLIRLSIGLENVDDLVEDLDQALKVAAKV